MDLSQPEPFGLLDDHHSRVGNVYADFDHGS